MPGIIASLAALLNSKAYQRAQEKKLVKEFVDNEMVRFDHHVAEILDSIERMDKDLFFYCNIEKCIQDGKKEEVEEYMKLQMKYKAVNAILTKGIERTKSIFTNITNPNPHESK